MELTTKDSLKQLAFRSADSLVSEKGSILIIALWSVCLLSVFAIIISHGARQKAILVQRLEERGKLYLVAEAGAKKAIAGLKKEEEKSYDSLNEGWSNNIAAFKDVAVADGSFSICYNYIDAQSGTLQTRYGLIDEERKININKVPRPILERLFRVVIGLDEMEAQELAASIIDWRDSDSELSIPLGSAEDPYYRNLTFSYEAKDDEFEILDEVLLVKGMTQNIFDIVKYYITIYGNGKVNINTASKEVLLALGLYKDIADKILSFRYGEDGVPGTSDDNIFQSHSQIVPKLSQVFNFSSSEIAHISAVSDLNLVTNSNNFMIRSVASLNNKRAKTETVCIVDRSGKILYWQES